MRKIYLQSLKMYFMPLLIVMAMVSHTLLAADNLEFQRDTAAVSKFWTARDNRYNVQLFSIKDCTEEQAKNEFKRLVPIASRNGVNLLQYPLFATRVNDETYGWGAVGIFYNAEDAQALANKLSFLSTNPNVRQPAKSSSVKLNFVIYRDPK